MLKIRLQRFGKKHQPTFRVVLTDSRNGPKSGNFIEVLGWRDPKKHTHSFKKERILHWISKGAKTSGTVNNLFVRDGIIVGKKIDVSPKTKPEDSKEKEGVDEKKEITANEKAVSAESDTEQKTDENETEERKETPKQEDKKQLDAPKEEKEKE